MDGMSKGFQRLCRLICERYSTFRIGVKTRGCAPTRGVALRLIRAAATAHQAARWRSGLVSPKHRPSAKAAALLALVIAFTVAMLNSSASESMNNPTGWPSPSEPLPEPQSADYSKFRHDNANHARLPCLLCHRRETNSPRPTLPGSNGHMPCAGCHAQQFAESAGPMCAICHTYDQPSRLRAFPRLSSFNMKFDHARHTRMAGADCATCHRPSGAGVAMTIPSGFNAHGTCFQCHTARATSGDRDISSCGVCHQPGRHTRMSVNAASFRVGFSHAKHNQSKGLTCNECHRVRAGAARRNQVSSPQALNHHASAGALSCMSCHNGKRAFGGDDFSVCKRCHTKATWHF